MPVVHTTAETVARIIARAYSEGETADLFGPEIRFSGDCTDPVYLHLKGELTVDHPKTVYHNRRNAEVWARCRKCDACLRQRSRVWQARIAVELAKAPRTWFTTLTLSPHEHFVALAKARKAFPGNLDAEPKDRIFKARNAIISAEITMWLKRVRKNSGAKLRYVLVCEAHKTGLPHYHALIHEGIGTQVLHRQLTDAWRLGFSTHKLVDIGGGSARYVTKYLAKSALARVRASARYGHTD